MEINGYCRKITVWQNFRPPGVYLIKAAYVLSSIHLCSASTYVCIGTFTLKAWSAEVNLY